VKHPQTASYHGAEILAPIQSLADIIPALSSHHERIDGKGYPKGLKMSQIRLWARMPAVADTYDALTSERPYRRGFSRDAALTTIENIKGTQLCPEYVQGFLVSVRKKLGASG
jgi:HD-GYP domain-containing protein (c-di-GMP phosphodiesterase class II)